MDLVERAATLGMRRGMRGSRPWLWVGVVATGVRLLRWLAKPKPDVMYRAVLDPGQGLEISTRRPR